MNTMGKSTQRQLSFVQREDPGYEEAPVSLVASRQQDFWQLVLRRRGMEGELLEPVFTQHLREVGSVVAEDVQPLAARRAPLAVGVFAVDTGHLRRGLGALRR